MERSIIPILLLCLFTSGCRLNSLNLDPPNINATPTPQALITEQNQPDKTPPDEQNNLSLLSPTNSPDNALIDPTETTTEIPENETSAEPENSQIENQTWFIQPSLLDKNSIKEQNIIVGQYNSNEYKNGKIPKEELHDFRRNSCGTASLLAVYRYYFYAKNGELPDLSIEDIISQYRNKTYSLDDKNYEYYHPDKTMFSYPILLILHDLDPNGEIFTSYSFMDPGYDPQKTINVVNDNELLTDFSKRAQSEIFSKEGALIVLLRKYGTYHFVVITSWQDPDNTGNPTVTLLDSYANNGLGEVYVGPLNEYWEKLEMSQAIGIIPNIQNSK